MAREGVIDVGVELIDPVVEISSVEYETLRRDLALEEMGIEDIVGG